MAWNILNKQGEGFGLVFVILVRRITGGFENTPPLFSQYFAEHKNRRYSIEGKGPKKVEKYVKVGVSKGGLVKDHTFPFCETQPSGIQKLYLSLFVRRRRSSVAFHTYLHCMRFKTIQTIHFLNALGPRISKPILQSFSCTNTQIQIHKYTNTAYDKVPERPKMWYIF